MARTTIFSALVAAGLLTTAADADAQQLIFSTTAPGGIASTGNTLGLSKAINENGPGIEHSIGTFITLDPSRQDNQPQNPNNPWPMGTTWDWTENGSAARLVIPDGATVLHAELIWAGSHDYYPETVTGSLEQPVELLADGAALSVSPDPLTAQTIEQYVGFWANYYTRTADVTAFVQQHGATVYAVSGVPATQSDTVNTLSAAGWSLVVAYRHDASPIRNLTIFVGGSFVDENATVDYEVTGFCAPPHGAVEGSAVIAALEGDANLTGEDFAIGETPQSTFVSLSGPNNPANNFFCSQINDNQGQLDTSGSFGDHNHDPFNGINVPGARQGWDHTTVAISSAAGHVANDQRSAVLRTSTVGDSYYPVLVAFELDVKSPDFSDSMTQASKQSVKIGDELTVTTTLANSGEAQADDLFLALPIDGGLELLDFVMDGSTGDANGQPVSAAALVSGVDSGDLTVGELRTIELKLRVVAPPDNGSEYTFAPDWGHRFTMCSDDAPIEEMFAGPTATVLYDAPQDEPDIPDETPTNDPDDGLERDPVKEGGCGCTLPGSDDRTPTGALALLTLGAAMLMRRRRQG